MSGDLDMQNSSLFVGRTKSIRALAALYDSADI